jgi:hypothetical protein
MFGILIIQLLCFFLFISNGLNGADYSVSIADRMIDFCGVAYCVGNGGHGVNKWDCWACQKQPQIIAVTECKTKYMDRDLHAFVAYDPDAPALVVSFSGTDPLSLVDWFDDLEYELIDFPQCQGCKVHDGFYKSWLLLKPMIYDALYVYWSEYGKGNYSIPVQVTGHSLGAALASNCAIDFVDNGIKPELVYVYGLPRVGNDNFANYYNSKIPYNIHVTHRRDPFIHMPTQGMGYHHVSSEIWYPNDPNATDYKTTCEGGEDKTCADQYEDPLTWDVADHLDYMGFDFTYDWIDCRLPYMK